MLITRTAPAFTGGLVDPGPLGNNWSGESLKTLKGFVTARREHSKLRQIQIAEAANMWSNFTVKGSVDPFLMKAAISGNPPDWVFPQLHRMAPHIFTEAMTPGDFTNLTTYVLDKALLGAYPHVPNTYTQVAKLNTSVRDFRAIDRWMVTGGEGPWDIVNPTEGFNRTKFATAKYSYSVAKYEKGYDLSWEAVINDDIGMFASLPERLAIGGSRTVELFYLKQIAGAAGPHSSFYGSAINLLEGGTIDNRIFSGSTVNPPINAANLILAAGAFMNQATAEGVPIDVSSDKLIVLVADGILYQTLKFIIESNQIASTILGGLKASGAVSPDIVLTARNWLSGNIVPVFAPELRNILTSNGATSWWLFAAPVAGRAAVELGFLQGFSTPQLYRKASNTVGRNGAGVTEEMGDFESMTTEFKGLIVFGGTRLDPRLTMASNGTSS